MFYRVIFLILFVSIVLPGRHGMAQARGPGDRQPAVAGSFYPAGASGLTGMLEQCFREGNRGLGTADLQALIVPHAGYVFSGSVAAAGYARLDPEKEYRNVFLIGTSHRALFHGAAVYTGDSFITPLGKAGVNSELAAGLVSQHAVMHDMPDVHLEEHSLEVQLPFLQHRLRKEFRIVPILLGTRDPAECRAIARALKPYFTPGNLFVVSTDFSHYPPMDQATEIDASTAKAVLLNNPAEFLKVLRQNESKNIKGLVTAMCAWPSVLTLLYLTAEEEVSPYREILYRNSGHAGPGDAGRTVGYWAIEVINNQPAKRNYNMSLTEEDKQKLLEIARKTLEYYLEQYSMPDIGQGSLTPGLQQEGGAFVTLMKDGELRGCIGRFADKCPVYLTVQKMAVAAATQDTRFSPVSIEELPQLEIEISLLSPLQPVRSKDEIEPGRHGIYIRKGYSSGTFLPQVASKNNWSVEEYLGRCARDKAGIGYYGWKDAELFVFEAEVFSEHEHLLR